MRCCLALVVLLTASCASVPRAPTNASERAAWPVLPPNSLGVTLNANQVLRVAFGERDATLNCVVAVTPKQIAIVGVTALGMRAFTVKYDGNQVTAEAQAGVPQAIPPERLVNDVQLVYWPLATLKKALAGSEWQVSEPAPFTRRLRRGDRLVAEVHYASHHPSEDAPGDAWNGRVWLVNLELGYTLTIESRRVDLSDQRH